MEGGFIGLSSPLLSSLPLPPLPTSSSTHLLKRRMKILIWAKSGRSAGSWAQQRSIRTASSSLCRRMSTVGRKYGLWLLRTFCTISVGEAGVGGAQA